MQSPLQNLLLHQGLQLLVLTSFNEGTSRALSRIVVNAISAASFNGYLHFATRHTEATHGFGQTTHPVVQ